MIEKQKTKLQPIINVQNVIKDFTVGGTPIRIIKGISLQIYPREFVMIYGPSGCGKSTLLNVINGWEAPTQGRVTLNGSNLYTTSEDERATLRHGLISMVHQSPNWIKSVNVIDNICIPYLLVGKDKSSGYERAKALLHLVALDKYCYYKPMDLSVGQQQRISLLRALINNPKIILADEPTGNLDTSSSIALMELFTRINEDLGRTLIMVTHNMDLLKYANKKINIIDGKVVDLTIDSNKPITRKAKYNDILDISFDRFKGTKERAKIG